jgi:hypothetical protein
LEVVEVLARAFHQQEVTVVLVPPAELAVKVVVLVLWVQMVMAATAETSLRPAAEVVPAAAVALAVMA